jgi:AraC-like DNA-binding protein
VSETGRHLLRALESMARRNRRGPGAAGALRALMVVARDDLARGDSYAGGKAYQTWLTIKEYLHENCHQAINRDSVARAFRLNPSYLSRLFTQKGGESFNTYLTRLRMERAEWLLGEGGCTIAEVSRRCGYDDPAHFSRLFRKRHGMAPTQYRTG